MTDTVDFRRVKEVEALAKKLGFGIDVALGRLLVFAVKDMPLAMYGSKTQIEFHSVEEIRAYLKGWESYSKAMKVIEFDAAEYKKRKEDADILGALKTKGRRKA